ncbi:MAG: 4-hydroxy-3-methylbut-2-enyl diphosphate reductase [Victivallaceae bacterium]|nr:4-hydroxy-3-methylbut-2-enyl diphosphate reductase [Victivallaceae bacterium]
MSGHILYLAEPHGVCSGVRRALDTVYAALAGQTDESGPIRVLHELIHNNYTVNSLKRRGVIFVETLAGVPDGATLLVSAHGAARKVFEEAARRGIRLIDATCPLVRKLQLAAEKSTSQGVPVILIGHRGHPETEGVIGHAAAPELVTVIDVEDAVDQLAFAPETRLTLLSQTTMNKEAVEKLAARLHRRFPNLTSGPGVCYATTDRQAAVRKLAGKCDLVLVIGSPGSSNSNRLCEIARECGSDSLLIDNADELPLARLRGRESVALTAGASAPEELVDSVIGRLGELGFDRIERPR